MTTSSTTSWSEILQNILAKFDAPIGTIHRLNPQDNHLYLIIASKRIPEPVLAVTRNIPLGKGIAGAAVKEKKPVTLCNISKYGEYQVVNAKALY